MDELHDPLCRGTHTHGRRETPLQPSTRVVFPVVKVARAHNQIGNRQIRYRLTPPRLLNSTAGNLKNLQKMTKKKAEQKRQTPFLRSEDADDSYTAPPTAVVPRKTRKARGFSRPLLSSSFNVTHRPSSKTAPPHVHAEGLRSLRSGGRERGHGSTHTTRSMTRTGGGETGGLGGVKHGTAARQEQPDR